MNSHSDEHTISWIMSKIKFSSGMQGVDDWRNVSREFCDRWSLVTFLLYVNGTVPKQEREEVSLICSPMAFFFISHFSHFVPLSQSYLFSHFQNVLKEWVNRVKWPIQRFSETDFWCVFLCGCAHQACTSFCVPTHKRFSGILKLHSGLLWWNCRGVSDPQCKPKCLRQKKVYFSLSAIAVVVRWCFTATQALGRFPGDIWFVFVLLIKV